jgi:hypothetical protein
VKRLGLRDEHRKALTEAPLQKRGRGALQCDRFVLDCRSDV